MQVKRNSVIRLLPKKEPLEHVDSDKWIYILMIIVLVIVNVI